MTKGSAARECCLWQLWYGAAAAQSCALGWIDSAKKRKFWSSCVTSVHVIELKSYLDLIDFLRFFPEQPPLVLSGSRFPGCSTLNTLLL
jgi:hypothetical protein